MTTHKLKYVGKQYQDGILVTYVCERCGLRLHIIEGRDPSIEIVKSYNKFQDCDLIIIGKIQNS
jgi:hypothetical protein